ncbi:CHASE2 domain-containing protein [Patulibacter defluvii]|uniref:CHASE2 domain-containing protein n=1 Tax=Patulibacter defluvii TaxID=3095358 RepID=UPI002A7566D7|nr:adenylate/guanylate cyclase domain-containing protein [Patulibacter sp. DM4]
MRRTRWLRLAAAVVLAAAIAAGLDALGATERAEESTVDVRFLLRGERPADERVVVVAIDDVTIGKLGLTSPLPRDEQARALRKIAAARPRVVAIDLVYRGASRINRDDTLGADDVALVDAIDSIRPSVLAITGLHRDDRPATLDFVQGLTLADLGARAGHTAFGSGAGGAFRRLPATVDGVPSMPAAVAAAWHDRGHGPPRRPRGVAPGSWIDFHGPRGTVPTYSLVDVRDGRVPASALRGKVVVIGDTTKAAQDEHPTAWGGQLMSGAEIEAQAIATALEGSPLRDAPGGWNVALLLLAAAIVPLAGLRRGGLTQALAAAIGLAGIAGAALLAFDHDRVLEVVPAAVALVLGTLGSLTVTLGLERLAERRARATLRRFAPAEVVEELLAADRHGIPPRELDVTVLFCDLRGFTSFAAGQPAGAVITILDRYLGEVTAAVTAHGGTVVSFLGDGVLAVFGAPLPADDHADRGLAAAREIVGRRLARFNAATGSRFAIGVGLHSGPVASGIVGPAHRIEYAAVGDTTNVAAKLEAATKTAGVPLLVSETTRERLRDRDGLRSAGSFDLRGAGGDPIEAWTV